MRSQLWIPAALTSVVLAALLLWKPRVTDNPPVIVSQTIEAILHPPPEVESILQRACRDCHGNLTEWPWYAHLRPVASGIGSDVYQARQALNFSEWQSQTKGDPGVQARTLQASCSLMQAGMMPPSYYLYIHPGAKLANSDVKAFCEWATQISTRLLNTPSTVSTP